MDGYALRGGDLAADAPTPCCSVAGTGFAGAAVRRRASAPGECVRIMTGAVMPAGLDTVVPQEFAKVDGDARDACRPASCAPATTAAWPAKTWRAASAALPAGRVLRPADLGLLASLGQAEVPVLRRLRVAFFSTGDELRSIGEPLDAGCVYDSNRYTLWGMLQRLGVELIDMGVVRDDPAALEAAFRQRRRERRRGDHLRRRQRRRGRPHQAGHGAARRRAVLAHRDAARPADGDRPHRQPAATSAILFGLPGNPVAVMVTFYAFVRDALLAMSGATVAAAADAARGAARSRSARSPAAPSTSAASSRRGADGGWQVAITGSQGSGILRSMSEANGLVVLHHEQGNVAAGELVDVLPFDGLV